MVRVVLWGSLRSAIEREGPIEIDAATLRELLDRLVEQHPEVGHMLEEGVSVAIDGRIYNDSWFQPIRPDSEVVVLPRIRGG